MTDESMSNETRPGPGGTGHEDELAALRRECDELRAELTACRQRRELTSRGANDGFWDWNLDTDTVHFSVRWKEIIGYADHEISDHAEEWRSRIHPSDLAKVMEANMACVRGETDGFEVEYRIRHKDGRWRWVLGRGAGLKDSRGRVVRLGGAHTDITRRKHAEETLRESEARHRALSRASFEAVFISEGGVLLEANQAAVDLFGYPLEELLGLTLADLVVEEDRALVIDNVSRGWEKPYRATCMHRDGGTFPCEMQGRMFHYRGRPSRVSAVRDISVRKQVEAQLVRAKEAAEHTARAKGEFLANMSHELRTPLNGIFGMLQLVLDTGLDEEQREYVDTALSTGRSLLAVINDILDFTKIEAGILDVAAEPFDLSRCVGLVMNNFKAQARDKNLSLETELPGGDQTWVMGDEARVRQILFNLVGNAVKFCDRGRVRVTVGRTGHVSAMGRRHLFIVSDTGIGIPDESLDDVFEPFTQVDGTSTRRYKGTGLGLGIVRRLISLMGGHLAMESEPGRGTTVYFLLDLPHAEGGEVVAEAREARPGRGLRILVAEDEAVNSMAVRMMLERRGHEVACAGTGREAVEMLGCGDMPGIGGFDCVLMDVQMPVMDGLEAVRAIRGYESKRGIARMPVIALTAHAMKGDRERFLEAGMDGYLAKPVDIGELEALLASVVSE